MRFTSTQFKTETKRDDSVELSRFFVLGELKHQINKLIYVINALLT